ncbi:ABC transporter family substrate-binding protein [Saccharothrix espanaensis]|uniref:ABC-type transporter, substrate-binding lipoprotein, family 5 n=1 Tax=Saccharothrix espanaensis (strain ATCC 51144 / DSM 44229 / JCM 9112 / NBRC 15066 / NRRL 15764) TaxID=1179773 RepID=K0JP30_SACES|nr:ABC transporter family substrate-binding protein [Saccharothrix espanaensis]CCH28175.1 ABC-type transporter, substrate-binding lipoprotein, family 5 [Saccharothrix espanaensis DSM 44229]
MRRSKAVSALALLTGAALLLSACGGGGAGEGDQGSQHDADPGKIGGQDELFKRPKVDDIGEISVAIEEGFHNYNNNLGATNNFSSTIALSNVQPSPYITDLVDGKFVIKIDGDLMESIKVTSNDPQVIEWKVNKAAVWSDGKPIDCDDFHLKWLSATSKATTKGEDGSEASIFDTSPTGYENIEKLECSNEDKTITTSFFKDKPFADYRALFSQVGSDSLLPAHVLEEKSGVPDVTKVLPAQNDETVKKVAEFYTKGWLGFDASVALSGGPYLIESSDLKDQTVLVRNPKWWGEKPSASKVVLKTNTDAQSSAQQLQNKEVVVIAPQADPAVAQQLRGDSAFKVYAAGGQTYEHVDFNMDRPLFKNNKELRLAIAQCFDREDLVEKLVKDVDQNAKPLGSFTFMPTEVGYEDHYGDVGKGDVAAAKKTLDDAGWKQGGDGIYTKGEYRASFKLGHKIVQRRADTVRILQDKCRQAGIEVVDDQAADFNDKRLPASEFDAALFAWVGQPLKAGAYGNYAQKDKGGTANYNNYDSAVVTEKWKAANGELDYQKRTKMMNDIDKEMRNDLHSVPLFQLTDFAAHTADISPISYIGVGGGVTWNLYAWQIKK